MTVFVALLRAINVGGTGILPMKELAALCTGCGLKDVRTYIQSGNVVFESALPERKVQSILERVLSDRLGKTVDVMVRSSSELRSILKANPFTHGKPSQVVVLFLAAPAPARAFQGLTVPGPEKVKPAGRQIYIHYPDGIGRSKLKLPQLGPATARNVNTLTKLAEMTKM